MAVERLDINEFGSPWKEEHLARYNKALGLIKDKNILDIACGTGYGSVYLLSNGAGRVTGVDLDPNAIKITKQAIAQELLKYLNHQISLAQLVDWAENAIMQGGMEPDNPKALMQILGRIAAADVKEFGILWEDCEEIMRQLGYEIKVDAMLAA